MAFRTLHRIQIILLALTMLTSGCMERSRIYPDRQFLETLWEEYKNVYIRPGGYVLDEHRGEVTSEGQSYAMLRALWMRDRETFGRVFQWTERHLLRQDGLYAWRWSPEENGKVLDWNSASDAHQDIAWALILASHVFEQRQYMERAKELLRAIRLHEGIRVSEAWFPAAGNWAVSERIVNLSYFIPYAYPFFDRADPDGQWLKVMETGYDLLNQVLAMPDVRLPPDFMIIQEDGRVALLPEGSTLSSAFSFDAMRIYWRVAMDCKLKRGLRACADPARTGTLVQILGRDGRFSTRYSVQGSPLDHTESLSFYGSLLPSLQIHFPALTQAILKERLSPEALKPMRLSRDRYYDANWTWFGLAAVGGLIEERTPSPESVIP